MQVVSSFSSRFTAIAMALSITALAGSALAASGSTFLVQLGQHATQEGARNQWDMLVKRYPTELLGLSLRVASVKATGGKEEFRTQAAGITTYTQAQSICSALSAESIGCSVVETSMYQPEEDVVPVQQAAQNRPRPERLMPQQSAGLTPERLDQRQQAKPAEIETEVVKQAKPVNQEEPGFGEKYLPWLGFGKKDAQKDANAPAANAEQQNEEMTPAEQIDSQPLDISSVENPTEQIVLEKAPAQSIERQEAELAAQDLQAEVAYRSPATAPKVFSYSRQPVQQAPTQEELAARAPRNLAAHSQAVSASAPQNPTPQVSNTQDVEGEVEIAEAVQVPVSSYGQQLTPSSVPVAANRPVGQGGFPSQPGSTAGDVPWVQIGQFNSKESAFNFSRDISRKHADLLQFTRIRIVSPFNTGRNATARQPERISMRLGPFKQKTDVNKICNIAKENGLNCTLVREVGTTGARANAAAFNRSRYNPISAQERRSAVSRGYNQEEASSSRPTGAYWVQLGAFDSSSIAQQRWTELKNHYREIFDRLQPQVSYPALSSSVKPVYHLRTGPFTNQASAVNTCDALQARNIRCIVVQARK